jgi:hypothetical protein
VKTEKQKAYLLAATIMAQRSTSTKYLSLLQSSFEEAKKLVGRSERQQKAAIRLLRIGGAFSQ